MSHERPFYLFSKIDYAQIKSTGANIMSKGLSMSRVIKTIEIEGQPVKALFDTGAFHSYVLRRYLAGVPDRLVPVIKPYEVALAVKPERYESAH